MDLTGGRHPDFNEEWLLDGSPSAPSLPYRRTCERRWIAGTITIAPQTLTVVALPVQLGDQFSFASIGVKTATGTPTHSWIAVYNGTGAGAAMLAQSADAPGGVTVGALSLAITAITTSIQVTRTVRPPQDGGAIVPAASVRVLRAAIGTLAAQFGYRRGTLNEVLAALGADRGDLEIMRQFLLAHEPPDGAAT